MAAVTTVYLVIGEDLEDRWVEEVFSNKESAERLIDVLYGKFNRDLQWYVQEWEVQE